MTITVGRLKELLAGTPEEYDELPVWLDATDGYAAEVGNVVIGTVPWFEDIQGQFTLNDEGNPIDDDGNEILVLKFLLYGYMS